MEHPKEVGDRSTLAIILALRNAGYGVLMPFGENTRYDLVAEDDNGFSRVQCKTGRLRNGAIRFSVCSSYGHHRNPASARRSYEGQIDSFAVFCPETGGVYLIPVSDVAARTAAFLRVDPPLNNQQNRIRHAEDYKIGRIAIEVPRPLTTAGLRGPSDA